MKARTGLMLLLATTLIGAAQAQVDFRWFDAFGNGGVVVAGVRNAAGSYIRITCSAGSIDPKADLQYERKQGRLKNGESIQIVIGDEVYQFIFGKDSFAQIDARTSRLELDRFADTLASTKATTFTVETPRLKFSETFSTKDAGKVLGKPGKTTVSGCGS